MGRHPNAVAAGSTAGAVALVVWVAALMGVELPAPVAVLAGGVITTVVAVGREGLRGLARIVWRGAG